MVLISRNNSPLESGPGSPNSIIDGISRDSLSVDFPKRIAWLPVQICSMGGSVVCGHADRGARRGRIAAIRIHRWYSGSTGS